MLWLETSVLGPLRVVLRPLTGADETVCGSGGLAQARALVARLLTPAAEGELGAERLDQISVADFDRILASLHHTLYGGRLECRITCAACDEPLEFTVALDAMLECEVESPARVAAPGWFQLPDGRRFRLPQVGEALAGLTAADLARACTLDTWGGVDLDRAMAAAGPQASDVIETQCPECGAAQQAQLDLAHFLMQMLERERGFLAREVHLLARSYHWTHREIMALPREARRTFVRLIHSEAEATTRTRRWMA